MEKKLYRKSFPLFCIFYYENVEIVSFAKQLETKRETFHFLPLSHHIMVVWFDERKYMYEEQLFLAHFRQWV